MLPIYVCADGLQSRFVQAIDEEGKDPMRVYQFSLCCRQKERPAILICKKMDDKFDQHAVYIEKNGNVVASNGQPLLMGLMGGYGEIFTISLYEASKNKRFNNQKLLGTCQVVPFPIIAENAQGQKLEICPLDFTGQVFQVNLSGFAPHEAFDLASRSCHEKMDHHFQADEKGCFSMMLCPAVVGRQEGPFEISVSNLRMDPLTKKHYWGIFCFLPPPKMNALLEKPLQSMSRAKDPVVIFVN